MDGLKIIDKKIENKALHIGYSKALLNRLNKNDNKYSYVKLSIVSCEEELKELETIRNELEILRILTARLYIKENYKLEVFEDSFYNVDAILMYDSLNNFEFNKDELIEDFYKVKKWIASNKVGGKNE